MSITLNLEPDTEQILAAKAARFGQTLEVYLKHLAERDAQGRDGLGAGPAPPLSDEEFDRLLDELSEGLPPLPSLPADFSRADIYADHD
jgi:hypothetical protein